MHQLNSVQIDSSDDIPDILTGNAREEYKKITDIYINNKNMLRYNSILLSNISIIISLLNIAADFSKETSFILTGISFAILSYAIYLFIFGNSLNKRINKILWFDFAPSNLINTKNFDMNDINSKYTEYKNKDDDVSYKVLLYMFDINTSTIQPSNNLCHIILSVLFPLKIPKFNS